MQLDTFWCTQLNTSNLAKTAFEVLVIFTTNCLRESGFSTLLHIRTKARNRLESGDDVQVAITNKELHCSMNIDKKE